MQKPNNQNSPEKVFLETFGCQMNILDSELVEDGLLSRGYEFTDQSDSADVVLYNTCSVRALSEQKVLSRLGEIKEQKGMGRDVVVGVLGCMAERVNKDILKRNHHIDLLVGPNKLDQIPDLLENIKSNKNNKNKSRELALSDFKFRKGKKVDLALMEDLEVLDNNRFENLDKSSNNNIKSNQAYVRITRGCNKFCSYCVVPRTRGPEVHRHPDAIVREVQKLCEQGYKEVTLLGQTINRYVYQDEIKTTTFAQLLKRVHDETPDLPRIRFMTSYPKDFTDEALDVMASSPRINNYLHVPVQSGNDRILKAMNRGYDVKTYLDLIKRAKKRMPDISILGDMIVGFPTESDQDFEDTLNLMREVKYKSIFSFKYSPRPGTIAFRRNPDDISQKIKKERNNKMLQFQKEISLKQHEKLIGQKLEILVESKAKISPDKNQLKLTGRTRGDHLVHFNGTEDLIGQILNVTVTDASELALKAKLS